MKIAYTNFTGGEISHSLAARYDLGKFKSSCKHLENFLPDLHGPVSKRPGTRFLEDVGGPAMLVPFQFSADPAQNYVLIFQQGMVRVAQEEGFVTNAGLPVAMTTPYAFAELHDISFAQSGDIVYLAHAAHPLRKIMRHGHTDWRTQEVSFAPPLYPPSTIVSLFSSGSGGTYTLRYKVACVDGKGQVSGASKVDCSSAKHPSDWVVGEHALLTWFPVAGAESYLVYREEGGVYGLIGVADGQERTPQGQVLFRDERFAVNAKDTPREPLNPFTQGNHPGLVAFHQQRLVLGAPRLQPQTFHASRTGSYEDFSKSKPLKDDDALEFTLASGRIDAIQWIAAFGDLLLGTAGGEYKAIGPDQGAITPSSINVREQSFWGSAHLRPLIIGNSVLHVQRQGSRVRDLTYSLERDGYAGNDLSVLASHLFINRLIVQWDYQQAPGSVLYLVRDDGMMLALTYMREHEIWGWSRIATQGKFRSVAVTAGNKEDTVYCVVERTINGHSRWYLECFAPRWHEAYGIDAAFFVDCGIRYEGEATTTLSGLEHLEGALVSVLADGSPQPLLRVANGCVTLASPTRNAVIGLPYRASLCPQTPEADAQDGATLGRVRTYGNSRIRFEASVGGSYGPNPETLYNFPMIPDEYGKSFQPFTGDASFNPDIGYSAEGALWFVQDLPLPFTIVAVTLEVDMAG